MPESIRAYNDTTLAIISRLGAKILHLHVHDIDPETWVEHKPLIHGFVDDDTYQLFSRDCRTVKTWNGVGT